MKKKLIFTIIFSLLILLISCFRETSNGLTVTPFEFFYDSLRHEILTNYKVDDYYNYEDIYDPCFLCHLKMIDHHQLPDAYYNIISDLLRTSGVEHQYGQSDITKENIESLKPFVREQVLYFCCIALALKQNDVFKAYQESEEVKKIIDQYNKSHHIVKEILL